MDIRKFAQTCTILAFIFAFSLNSWADEIDDLVPCIIKIESSGNPLAVGSSGEIGLMQISPIVLKEWNNTIDTRFFPKKLEFRDFYKQEHLFNATINVKIGTWYLRRIWNHYLPHYNIPQTPEMLLAAYNWGIGNLAKFNKEYGGLLVQDAFKHLPKSVQRYIRKVLNCRRSK